MILGSRPWLTARRLRVGCPDVCTVLLRLTPGAEWPLLLAAVRDEFVDRAWDAPDAHWSATAPGLVGGRDRTAGGTWLAVRPNEPAVAALLNGVRMPQPAGGVRPSRGGLPLAALSGLLSFDTIDLADYDGFHLLVGTPDAVVVWSWDGSSAVRRELEPGDHILVNAGIDTVDDPLVTHFLPLLRATPTPALESGADTRRAWRRWVDLLLGDELPGDDPRALLVRHEFDDRIYGSTSASLVAVGRNAVRFDFTATPDNPTWSRISIPVPPS
jgi:hypothetical protein